MKPPSRRLVAGCAAASVALGAIAIIFGAILAGEALLPQLHGWIARVGARLPALITILGGLLVMLGIALLAVSNRDRRRRVRYRKSGYGPRSAAPPPEAARSPPVQTEPAPHDIAEPFTAA